MERVLILGGSGLVGTAVIREMENDGRFDVFSTYHSHPEGLNPGRDLPLDVEDPESIGRALQAAQPDLVVSCLRGDFARQLEVHQRAAEYLNGHGGRLCFFSTTNVFDNDLKRPHTESDLPDAQTEYGRFKAECERRLCAVLGDCACFLRLPQVWGKDSPRLRTLLSALRSQAEIVVYPNLFHNTNTDVMIAKQLCYIITHQMTGIFHLAAEDFVNYKAFYVELAAKLGFPDAVLKEEMEEAGIFALLSERSSEFPEALRITNQGVIHDLVTRSK